LRLRAAPAAHATGTVASGGVLRVGHLATLASLALLGPGPPAPPSVAETHCYDPAQADADYEAYGPTDVNVQSGDGRVTVGENRDGTVTVFKYPNPSFYNQVKYVAVSRDAAGRAVAQFPNEGSFAGVEYRTPTGTRFSWLRGWPSEQRYDSPDVPIPVTTYRSPGRLGLTVSDVDLTSGGSLVREFWVTRSRNSPVRAARLVYFENFNPVASRLPYLPILDWCLTQLSDQRAAYDRRERAIVHSWQGVDAAAGAPSSVAFAFGFDGGDAGHQVGRDGRDPASAAGPPDGFDQAGGRLGGSDSATGQVTGTLSTPLVFDRRGRAAARLTVGSGRDPAAALRALRSSRRTPFARQMSAVARSWRDWLSPAELPASEDPRVIEVAKRALISIRLAIVPGTGAIVASSDTQGPYGEDWIRDGSFINQVLDMSGHADEVTAHNLFYARVQTSPANPSPIRPSGNWPMASYGDGIDGAPIPWEIDETGLGIWALWSHAEYLQPGARTRYVSEVYPAIARAADFLVECQDPLSGLQCPANEDDNPTPSQSLHGAETVLLGLRSAVAAAAQTRDAGPRAAAWRARLARLDAAIKALYDPRGRAYREGDSTANAYNVEYGDGGWLLWPVAFRPYADPTMQGEAAAVRRAMDSSLASAQGSYEAKGLLGLAHASKTPALRGTLDYMAAALTTSTGHFGEAWRRIGARPQPLQDMPHVWEGALFYLAAVEIDGARPYTFASEGLWRRACRAGAAPPSACRP
jgi:GH15 family glucan-1,4-alpha-glucosidase